MRLHGIASILLAVFTGLSPIAAFHGPARAADPSPAPAVSFAATETSPVLTQQSAGLWTTSIVVEEFPACLRGLRYELVTTWPDALVPGRVVNVINLGPEISGGTSQPGCSAPGVSASAWASEVDLHFSMTTVPRGAAVMLEAPDGIMALPAITLTVHRYVSRADYVLIPFVCGLALVALFLAAVMIAVAWDDARNETGLPTRGRRLYRDLCRNDGSFWKRFWHQPLFASAAWTFKDSWATNVTVGVSATTAVLAAFGTVSTLFPGVQLDRFAILMAATGAIIAVAPLVFGIATSWWPSPYVTLPDNSLLRAPADQPMTLQVAAGASMRLPAGTIKNGAPPTDQAANMNVVPAEPQPLVKFVSGWIALTKDGTIAAPGGSAITVGPPPEVSIAVGADGAVVTVVGVADLMLPRRTEVITPASAAPDLPGGPPPTGTLPRDSILKIPSAGNVMNADMRSVVPAAIVTMFGIGAELGILGVLAFLSTGSVVIRACTIAVLALSALIVVGYAGSTTRSLADSGLGSALSASSTSFVY
jgi:hypothetical protein